MRFRKKPVVIEAVRWTGDNQRDIEDDFYHGALAITTSTQLVIPTLEGRMRADVGDWIIKGVKGEFYPCKPDIFDATYEAVE